MPQLACNPPRQLALCPGIAWLFQMLNNNPLRRQQFVTASLVTYASSLPCGAVRSFPSSKAEVRSVLVRPWQHLGGPAARVQLTLRQCSQALRLSACMGMRSACSCCQLTRCSTIAWSLASENLTHMLAATRVYPATSNLRSL